MEPLPESIRKVRTPIGYTHYFYRPRTLDRQLFNKAVGDCKKICDALPIPLGDWEGKGKPKFAPSVVCFNGHVHSEVFSKDGNGLVWPGQNAEAVAAVGESTINGAWCGGATVNARCVNDDGDGSYETFQIKRTMTQKDFIDPAETLQFGFCKTNYRPYDLCVQCCLIVFKHYFSDQFKVRSDGSAQQWFEACNDCQAVLGYGLDFALDE